MTTVSRSIAAGADDGGWTITELYENANVSIDGGVDGPVYVPVLRFTNITIPQGATISSAILTVVASAGAEVTGNYKIVACDEDNSAQVTNLADIAARPQTTAGGTGSVGAIGLDDVVALADCAAAIQEVVDRPGWSSGNAITLLITDVSQGSPWGFYAFEGAGTEAALVINYSAGGGAGAIQQRQRLLLLEGQSA